MRKIIIYFFILVLCSQKLYVVDAKENHTYYAKSAVVIDGDSGRILYGKAPETKMAIASTTKIITCIVALENCNLEQKMSVSSNAVNQPKVRMNVKKDEQYYLKDLLYALMLESYNDVAVVIAENLAGSVEEFATLMNQKAKELGMLNSNFVTPNGLDADKHYSTAYDMALAGAYAINNQQFVEIINTKKYTFTDVSGKRNVTLVNRDGFLNMDNEAIGIKTGFTGKAGYCFVGAVKSEGRTFVSCVLASGWPPNKTYKWRDTKELMDYARKNYFYRTIYDADKVFNVKLQNGTKKSIKAKINDNVKILISDKDIVKTNTQITYKYPIMKNDKVGAWKIYVNNELIEEYDIHATETAIRYDFKYCFRKVIEKFLKI